VADILNHIQENNAYLTGLILWLGFTPYVVYYHRQAREKRYGRSMWTFTRKLRYFTDTFVAFSHMPLRLASFVGLGLSFLGLIYALIIVLSQTFFGQQPEGWSSIMVVLLVAPSTENSQ
jgi:dolichol-phosphate mannosyltransferase